MTYVFLGGSMAMEPVMVVATRLQMAQHPTITVLSLPELFTYYSNNARLASLRPTPSPLTLLRFYLAKKAPSHVFVDEAPLETQWDIFRQQTAAALKYLPLPPTVMAIVLYAAIVPAAISVIFLVYFAVFFSPWCLLLPLLSLLCPFLLRFTSRQSSLLPLLLALSLVSQAATGLALLHTPWLLFPAPGFRQSSLLPLLLALSLASQAATALAQLHTPWLLFPASSFVLFWSFLGWFLHPYSLSSTSSILSSLPSLLPSSATLWIAIHSTPLADTTGTFRHISHNNLDKWRRSLAPTFTCPSLRCNLRNTLEVYRVQEMSAPGDSYTTGSTALRRVSDPPQAAPSLCPSSTEQLLLPLASPSELQAAMVHLLPSLPTPLVVLLQEPAHHRQVEAAFLQRNIPAVTFLLPSHLDACKAFLSRPQGALITTGAFFSGMEARTIVLVKGRRRLGREMERSDRLRAIEQVVMVHTDPREGAITKGGAVEPRFARCRLAWTTDVWRCPSCPSTPFLCNHCRIVCHRNCQDSHWNWNRDVYRSHLQCFLPVTSCSCRSSNMCKLARP